MGPFHHDADYQRTTVALVDFQSHHGCITMATISNWRVVVCIDTVVKMHSLACLPWWIGAAIASIGHVRHVRRMQERIRSVAFDRRVRPLRSTVAFDRRIQSM
jgi:hypothetical protein